MTDIRDMEAAFFAAEGEGWQRRRGYDRRQLLFAGFPPRVRWLMMRLKPSDLRLIHNDAGWRRIAGPLRQVRDAANWVLENPDTSTAKKVQAIVEADPKTLPPIVLVGIPYSGTVILEGNHRAVAWALRYPADEANVLLGLQEQFDRWHYFRDRSRFRNWVQGWRDR